MISEFMILSAASKKSEISEVLFVAMSRNNFYFILEHTKS